MQLMYRFQNKNNKQYLKVLDIETILLRCKAFLVLYLQLNNSWLKLHVELRRRYYSDSIDFNVCIGKYDNKIIFL